MYTSLGNKDYEDSKDILSKMPNLNIDLHKSLIAKFELEEKADYIKKILSIEEEKFNSTIDQGTAILDEYMQEMKAAGTDRLEGEKAFKLYDTYGFPIELTKEILEEQGYTTDIE